MMTTREKIEALGALYREACHCTDTIALVQDRLLGDRIGQCEELLDFARKVAQPHPYDMPMHDLINAFRAVLENEVHTAAGQ